MKHLAVLQLEFLKKARKKRSFFFDQRKRQLYNNGAIMQLGDHVVYKNKPGRIVNYDRQTVNIRYDDGSGFDNVQLINVQKIA
ncbi:MAG: hypothetical protein Q7R33_06030 [Nitrosarchaeum sp.]|nr:hypothetical protein [Nitrosarchaeum sp.]